MPTAMAAPRTRVPAKSQAAAGHSEFKYCFGIVCAQAPLQFHLHLFLRRLYICDAGERPFVVRQQG